MDEIKIFDRPKLHNPVMLCAWPGMGDVGLQAVDYLREKLNATYFAEVDLSQEIYPELVIIKDGITKRPEPDKNVFYYSKNPDLIFFEGEIQISGRVGMILLEKIITVAREFEVKQIFTGAAFPLSMNHHENSKVMGVATSETLKNVFEKQHMIEILSEGQISGLNGLLLGVSQKYGIEAGCLLASLPVYAVNFPNPKASMAIITVLQKILNISVDLSSLEAAVGEMEKKFDALEKQVKSFLGDTNEPEKDGKIEGVKTDVVSTEAVRRIEKFFIEAKTDQKKAYLLKTELDRWGLFKYYEDRFLDLFNDHH